MAWIETLVFVCVFRRCSSPPARVAWIETSRDVAKERGTTVATREGGVDRNTPQEQITLKDATVATREGGVDRNVILTDWKYKEA